MKRTLIDSILLLSIGISSLFFSHYSKASCFKIILEDDNTSNTSYLPFTYSESRRNLNRGLFALTKAMNEFIPAEVDYVRKGVDNFTGTFSAISYLAYAVSKANDSRSKQDLNKVSMLLIDAALYSKYDKEQTQLPFSYNKIESNIPLDESQNEERALDDLAPDFERKIPYLAKFYSLMEKDLSERNYHLSMKDLVKILLLANKYDLLCYQVAFQEHFKFQEKALSYDELREEIKSGQLQESLNSFSRGRWKFALPNSSNMKPIKESKNIFNSLKDQILIPLHTAEFAYNLGSRGASTIYNVASYISDVYSNYGKTDPLEESSLFKESILTEEEQERQERAKELLLQDVTLAYQKQKNKFFPVYYDGLIKGDFDQDIEDFYKKHEKSSLK